MHDPWVAVDLAADPVAWARLLRRAHEVFLGGRGTAAVVRDVIADSWQRCTRAGVDPDRPAPTVVGADEAAARLARHPLAGVLPVVRPLLRPLASDARHLLAIADGDGLLLHTEGHPTMVEAARQPRLVPGCRCSEAAVGTNAIGTALALDHPVQVFSAEHFNRLLHGWAGAAAPVHAPATTRVLGAIALFAAFRNAHPHTLALVAGLARLAEAELARARACREAAWRDRYLQVLARASRRPSALVDPDGVVLDASPAGWAGERIALCPGGVAELPDGARGVAEPLAGGAHVIWRLSTRATRAPRPALGLRALGVAEATAWVNGRRVQLGPRHSEIVVLLALAEAGIGGRELARGVYGPGARLVTLRAEIARLRRVLGVDVAHNPYRLLAEVHADVLDVERLLRRGDVRGARARYCAPLLPASRAPAVAAARQRLEAGLRNPLATVPGVSPAPDACAMLAPAGGRRAHP